MPTEPTQPETGGVSGLQVYFLDVGQADAALVRCGNMNMLIDGGNAADSNLLYSFLKRNGISHLDYVIGTHAHEDHIGGIAGALRYATVGTVYCPVRSYSSTAFNNFDKAVKNHGKTIQIPSVGTSFSLGSAKVTILAVNTSSDTNNSSIVLRITYGSTSFLFTGDAEREVEQAMLNRGAPLGSTVLKVGHHGSETSTSYAFLRSVMPKYSVISVGKGNSYGHPTEAVLSRLRDCGTKLFRTDMQGDIVATSNGNSISFYVAKNANADTFGGLGNNSTQPTEPETEPTQPQQPDQPETIIVTYIANTNSLRFHEPNCSAVEKMSQQNKMEFYGTREELLEMGYTPCGICDP